MSKGQSVAYLQTMRQRHVNIVDQMLMYRMYVGHLANKIQLSNNDKNEIDDEFMRMHDILRLFPITTTPADVSIAVRDRCLLINK